jgi:hypothetical protein
MDPIHVAARFTAFTAYLNEGTAKRSPDEAGRLARENWPSFMPLVDEELARFLATRSPVPRSERSSSAPDMRRKVASLSGNGSLRRAGRRREAAAH